MARKVRIEYPGAVYHVINRGNYRSWIFESEGAKRSFLLCLQECCEASGWILHGWCLMGNHYHLALETPGGNLISGMRWLQSTFANRFNRFRNERGHVFQGRYKSILLDEGHLGALCHYIHLNPVRAGIVPVEKLKTYQWSSFHRLWNPRERWRCEDFSVALRAVAGTRDTPAGRRRYRDYLTMLAADPGEQKNLAFERLNRGWAQGSEVFRNNLKAKYAHSGKETGLVETEVHELKEAVWEKTTQKGLRALGKGAKAIREDAKGADWKVALARLLRERHLASNGWIAERLAMGKPGTVSQYVNRHKRSRPRDKAWAALKNAKMLD